MEGTITYGCKRRRPTTDEGGFGGIREGRDGTRERIAASASHQVIDLRRRFAPDACDAPDAKVLIVCLEDRYLGLIVDTVSDVVRVADSAINPLDNVAASPALAGVLHLEGETVLIIAVDGILSAAERGQLETLAVK